MQSGAALRQQTSFGILMKHKPGRGGVGNTILRCYEVIPKETMIHRTLHSIQGVRDGACQGSNDCTTANQSGNESTTLITTLTYLEHIGILQEAQGPFLQFPRSFATSVWAGRGPEAVNMQSLEQHFLHQHPRELSADRCLPRQC